MSGSLGTNSWAYYFLSALFFSSYVSANANFGGPDAVENTIKDNKREKQSWRENLASDHKLTFGLDYQALGLSASDPTEGGEDKAAAGVVRFYGSWGLTGTESANTGSLVWKVEHRHAYTELSPKEFSFIGDGLGYAGMIGPAYSDQGARLTNLYWKQKVSSGQGTLMVGYLDTTDYVDVYALASPWNGFTNLAFSTGGGAIGLPDDGILGVAFGHMLNENFYAVAGIADGKGKSDDPLEGFDNLFNDSKLFTTLELGWTASKEEIYTDNFHVTAWHLDGGTQHNLTNTDGGKGINFSFSYFANPQIMPFVRGGISQGDVALYDKSLTVGLGYFGLAGENNNLGFAVNWSNVNDNLEHAYGVGESTQLTTELYYNVQLNDIIQITPDLQYIKDPAFSSESSSWVIGLRARFYI
ncbi:carbohydrate porin [Shewanella sp. 1CM18E]|uniref:carbohydrate porin n=1 Tax=Shewanella sp. 1CM18E TaxID=2929169 RepID=UPI0020BF4FFA|nr:carbohydrate porin [Shewanella sp. 1CM18E]MCK8044374.1 carbohydrate porin [Shewanella sp. 1CM18E]